MNYYATRCWLLSAIKDSADPQALRRQMVALRRHHYAEE